MRQQLVDWMSQQHGALELNEETLHLATRYLDTFLFRRGASSILFYSNFLRAFYSTPPFYSKRVSVELLRSPPDTKCLSVTENAQKWGWTALFENAHRGV